MELLESFMREAVLQKLIVPGGDHFPNSQKVHPGGTIFKVKKSHARSWFLVKPGKQQLRGFVFFVFLQYFVCTRGVRFFVCSQFFFRSTLSAREIFFS